MMQLSNDLFPLNRRGFLRVAGGTIFSISAFSLIGCGGNGSTSNGSTNGGGGAPGLSLTSSTIPVTVTFPAGMATPTNALVQTSLGSAPLVGGKASATIFNGGPHFTQVVDGNGNILMVGWVGSNGGVINTHTTSEVLLYFALCGPLLTDDLSARLIHDLATESNVQTVADTLTKAMASNPIALTNADATVLTALISAYQALAPSSSASTSSVRRPADVLVNPANTKSGIMVNQPGLNTISITNSYRRRGFYFVDKISYVDSSGTNQNLPQPMLVSTGDISATVGATSVLGSIQGYLGGDVAYGPVSTDAIAVPLDPSGARTTTYQVTIIGAGASQGDLVLTGNRLALETKIIETTLFIDFFLPLVTALIAIPSVTNRLNAVLASGQAANLLQDTLAGFINNIPGLIDKANSGDFKGALHLVTDALRSSNSARVAFGTLCTTLFSKLGAAFPGSLSGLSQITQFTNTLEGDGSAASGGKTGVFTILARFDAILTSIDSCIQLAQILASDRVDTWNIIANAAKVKLTPTFADVPPDPLEDPTVFTATVPDASDSGTALTYHWNIGGTGGGFITDGIHDGTDFDSSKSSVNYSAGNGEGSDILTVEAFQVNGEKRISLGTATAPITIKESTFLIAPTSPQLQKGASITFALQPSPGANQSYVWRTSGKNGTLIPTSGAETTRASATYTAGQSLGSDSITCEVFSTSSTSDTAQHVSLGTVSTKVSVVEQITKYSGTFSVDFKNAGPNGYDGGDTCQTGANVHFALVPGAKTYSIHCYGFNDTAYWGTQANFTFAPGQDGLVVTGNSAYFGLAGGSSDCAQGTASDPNSVAYYTARFKGIIVEVTPHY
jgi:hypothetical protein